MEIRKKRIPPGVLILVLSLIGLVWYLVLFFDVKKPPKEVPDFDAAAALALCQLTLQRTSSEPAKAVVPLVRGIDTGKEYQFVWDGSSQRMKLQGEGGPEVEGACAVNKLSRTISSLSLAGRQLF